MPKEGGHYIAWIVRIIIIEWFPMRVLLRYLFKVTLLVLAVVTENEEDAYTQYENEQENNSADNTS